MILVAVVLCFIEVCISYSILKMLDRGIQGIPFKSISRMLYRICFHPLIAFILNVVISTGISVFTGVGYLSGAANLGASVIVAVIAKYKFNGGQYLC